MYIRSPYPPLPPVPPTNYHNILFRTPDQLKLPDYVMYIDGVTGQQRTRYEFVERMYDVVTALGADKAKGGLGLGSECMVGILSDNCLDYCTLVHALLALTTPFALFSSYATSRELKHYLEGSKATHIFVHASLLPKLLPAAKEEGLPLENIFILDGQAPPNVGPMKTLESMIQNTRASEIPREPVRPAGKDTLAYLVFSSGTSGLPKAVMISHGNLIASLLQGVVQGIEYVRANPDVDPNIAPVTLGFLPLFHSFGLHYLCLKIPLRPATIILLPRWNLELALKAIPKYRITHLALIPSVIHTLVSSPKFAKTDFSSIVAIGSGAAYLPPALAEKVKTKIKQARVSEGYGMSEATLSLIGQPLPNILKDTIEHVPYATGILVPGVDAVVLRPDGSHCLPNEAGELYVKGDNVALGYWNDPDSTKESFLGGGWLKTGDRFRVTLKGTFYFEDRAKDTLKVSGMQVAPAELEDTILSTPGQIISDVAVGGVHLPTARTSDDKAPRAWVVLTAKGKELGKEKASKEVEEWIRRSLSKYKWLRGGVEVVDQLPKSPTGKVLRRVLVDKYQASSTRSKL